MANDDIAWDLTEGKRQVKDPEAGVEAARWHIETFSCPSILALAMLERSRKEKR